MSSSLTASAQDKLVTAYSVLDTPPAFSWAGAYLGLHAGPSIPLHVGETIEGVSADTSQPTLISPPSQETIGPTVGISAGYNWQINNFVYGVETEFNYLGGRGGSNGLYFASSYGASGPYQPYLLSNHDPAEFFGAMSGRIGFAADRAFFYAKGGVATGGSRGPATLTFPAATFNEPFEADHSQSTAMKYLAGLGLEYAISEKISGKFEYLFLNQALNSHIFNSADGFQYTSQTNNQNYIMRFGLNYHLGEKNDISTSPTNNAGGEPTDGGVKDELYSVHGQSTNVVQGYPKFPALYNGPNSLNSKGQVRAGSVNNLFMGLRVWDGGGVYVNPEVNVGYGLSNSVGAAAYPNAAVPKVGSAEPYMRFQRYFFRQMIGLGGTRDYDPDEGSRNEVLEAVQNQLAGKVDKDRIVLTVGKFAVPDVFDDNVYAHDPFTGFLNFAFNELGPLDYAADSWGYTYGVATEWLQNWWAVRAGVFNLSTVPNGVEIEPGIFKQYMAITEFEARYKLFEAPGKIKFILFGDNGNMSKTGQVTDLAYVSGIYPPSIENLRMRRFKTGGGINIQQQLIDGVGVFLRAGLSDGRYETVDYTDVDRQISFGTVLAGKSWGRPKDEFGSALAFGGLSGSKIKYFAAGGTSVYIGDGALTYGGEKAFETYYKLGLRDWVDATFDYQFLVNPGFNYVRGPVNVFGVRLHAQF